MKRVVLLFLILTIGESCFALLKQEFYINDEIENSNIFYSGNSEMLDTNSARFLRAKKNVLDYCNTKLDFNIDSASTYYSCREYFKLNSLLNESNKNLYESQNLKYQFFITFKIKKSINYRVSFYLDSSMQVQYASK